MAKMKLFVYIFIYICPIIFTLLLVEYTIFSWVENSKAVSEELKSGRKRMDDQNSSLMLLKNRLEKSDKVQNEEQSRQNIVLIVSSTLRCEKAKTLNLIHLKYGVYYFHFADEKNWTEAKNFCANNGMDLASFESREEFKNFASENPKKGTWHYYWTTASDISQEPGHFVWADGTKVDDTLWGEPNNNFGVGKETCVFFLTQNDKMYDEPCNETRSIMCELAKQDQLCL